jgi:hypothetical protein
MGCRRGVRSVIGRHSVIGGSGTVMSSSRISVSGIGRVGMRSYGRSGRRIWRSCVASGPLLDARTFRVMHGLTVVMLGAVFCVSVVLLFR